LNRAALLRSARRIQRRIEAFYALEAGPDVGGFIGEHNVATREALVVRDGGDAVELLLLLPSLSETPTLDERMQLVEGVSHFVYLAERARVGLPSTALELELQAEVDKFVVLAFDGSALAHHRADSARRALFYGIRYLDAPETELGQRYRLANDLARRVSLRVFDRRVRSEARRWLMRFYRSGQTEKIHLARAA
jgi:hypothetical protein